MGGQVLSVRGGRASGRVFPQLSHAIGNDECKREDLGDKNGIGKGNGNDEYEDDKEPSIRGGLAMIGSAFDFLTYAAPSTTSATTTTTMSRPPHKKLPHQAHPSVLPSSSSEMIMTNANGLRGT